MANSVEELQEFVRDKEKAKITEHLENRLLLKQVDNKVIVGNHLALEIVSGDNIMILEDEYVDGSICKDCKGKGKNICTCVKCGGSGNEPNSAAILTNPIQFPPCGRCEGQGQYLRECKMCNGTGKILILAPQAVAKPTSGKIVSLGPDCKPSWWQELLYWLGLGGKTKLYSMGDRVAYSGYTGHLLPFKGNNRLRVMGEREPFCLITNLAQDTDQGQETKIDFVDQDTAYKME